MTLEHAAVAALCLTALLAVPSGVAWAQQGQSTQGSSTQAPPSPPRLTIDELLNIDVTSVSKHAEPLGETAAAVTILRQDDLRRAGVTSLPDALRLATGVDVAQVDGRTWAISARGFDISTANKMAVFIDGRSVYTPLFSGTFWDVQDLVLDDVDRIEVIRGPGGALWGANAVNGVINIITKSAADTTGTLVKTGAGNDLGQAVVRYGRAVGKTGGVRVYGKYRDRGPQVFANGDSAKDPLRIAQAGSRLDVDFGRTAFTLQGDAYKGHLGSSDRPDSDVAGGNVIARLTRTAASGAQLQIQGYYDGTYRMVPRQFTERRDTADLDAQYRLAAIARQDITVGGGVDVTRGVTTPSSVLFFDPSTRTTALASAFAQDVIGLVPQRLFLTVGSKVEHNAYTGFEYQPTIRLRWTPVGGRTFWGAVSRAVRMPTRFDTDLRIEVPGTSTVVITGSPNFASETLVADELGYRQAMGKRLVVGATVFLNTYDHLRSQEPTLPFGVPIVLSNLLMARTEGMEIGALVQPTPHWELQTSYSFLRERFHLAPGSLDATGGASEANDPSHQFSIRSFVSLPHGTEVDATVRAVGALPHPAIPGYAELTLHFGVRPIRVLELALIGQNLLHGRHEEGSTLPNREEFVRSVLAQATWRF